VLSGLLLAVAVFAIVSQVAHVRDGTVALSDARFSIVAYSLIAVYAIASLIIRLRMQGKP
jgi:hypothetical protein